METTEIRRIELSHDGYDFLVDFEAHTGFITADNAGRKGDRFEAWLDMLHSPDRPEIRPTWAKSSVVCEGWRNSLTVA